MRAVYAVQTTVIQATPPPAPHEWLQTPDLPSWALVVVEAWADPRAQDAWEALPGVIEYPLWGWAAPVPPAVVSAFGSWGIVTGDTLGGALRKIRTHWPAVRP